jgi:hypothetical protein
MADKKRIQIGWVYSAKVGGSFVSVRAEKSLGHGRYEGTTVRTNRTGAKVKFSTDAVRGDGMPEEKWRKSHTPVPDETPLPELDKPAAKAARRGKAKGPKGQRKLSGLDAAAQVLAEADEPLNTKALVERMLAKGLWQTHGKTPAATLYAAIIREIATKGKEARFRKIDRGLFELTAAGKEAK